MGFDCRRLALGRAVTWAGKQVAAGKEGAFRTGHTTGNGHARGGFIAAGGVEPVWVSGARAGPVRSVGRSRPTDRDWGAAIVMRCRRSSEIWLAVPERR
jgi:hypothetical protein